MLNNPIDIIKEINQDCDFTEKIKESKFIESSSKKNNNYNYNSLCQCIISSSDPLYETIPNNEKNNILKIKY